MNTKVFVILFCTLFLIILIGLGVLFQKKIAGNTQTQEQTNESELNIVGSEGEETFSPDVADITNLEGQQQNPPMPQSQQSQAPAMSIDTNKKYSAILETTEGNITIAFTTNKTPITVNNFITLAKKDFYDNTIFHRVIEGFMIQGGDPRGDGTGGPGYKFADEPFDGDYTRGTVAMANSGPNTNGSQFFIMHETSPLPKNYVIFGQVTEGLDIVDAIATAEVKQSWSGEQSQPVSPVTIKNVKIIEE